jgi:methionyl aminopeptidase
VIVVRSEDEIAILREANRFVADVLCTLADMVAPGATTLEMDRKAADMCRAQGVRPAFLGYRGYPATTCISVDDVIVHGIPTADPLPGGVLVSIDFGVVWKGYYGDAALTVPCGEVDDTRLKLMEVTNRALAKAVSAARDGNHLRDVSRAVQREVEKEGFSVVRCFVGHGIGTQMHEQPQVPNYETGQRGPKLCEGMVLAIEPMVNVGLPEVRHDADGWTARTIDGKPSAHFEHSVVVRVGGGEVLSTTPRRAWGGTRNTAGTH